MDGYTFESEAPRAVRDYLAGKTLTPSFSWLDVMPEEHAFNFTVAKAMKMDVLTSIRDSLQTALEDGTPFESWARDLEPELVRLGWWGKEVLEDPLTGDLVEAQLGSPRRLRTIFWANTRTARAHGQWERIERTKAALPYLIYTLGPSENHRPLHAAKEGTIAPVDSPFWSQWMGPNGWGCKCGARQISRREAERRGYTGEEPPEVPTETFLNERTGESREVPQGIDPGWDTNPGQLRAENITNVFARKLEETPPAQARAAVFDLMRDSEVLAMMLGERPGMPDLPIAVTPKSLQNRLGSAHRTVVVSADTLAGHNIRVDPNYPEPREWIRIMDAFINREGELWLDGDGLHFSLFLEFARPDIDGKGTTKVRRHRATFKRTERGNEIYIKGFKINDQKPRGERIW